MPVWLAASAFWLCAFSLEFRIFISGDFFMVHTSRRTFLAALVPFLSSLQGDQASRIIPLVGALVPLSTWGIEALFLDLSLDHQQTLGLILLVVGAVVLTLSKTSARRSWSAIGKATLAAILFAASFVLTKYIYQQSDFLTAFMWMRLGGLLVSVALLLDAAVRQELSRLWREQRRLLLGGYLGNQVVSGFGFLLQSYAIGLGTATLVTAVQGVQYAVLILLVLVASRIKPELLQETINKRMMLEKLTAVAIVAAGLYLFAL